MIEKNGFYYVHSAKKFCQKVDALPEGATFYGLNTCAIPKGMILEDVRKGYNLYHCHLVNGSNHKKTGKFGRHEVYILKN